MNENKQDFFPLEPKVVAEPGELEFLRILNVNKKVIFDWGYDYIWVVENNDETIEDNCHCVSGERFHQLTGIPGGSSADTVVSSLKYGVDVEVRDAESSFKTDVELKKFMEKCKKSAQVPEDN